MATSPTDRRVARTQTSLQDAFLALIRKKGYEAITITDICAAANVGRSTFYAHFTGKDDLKRKGLAHLRHALVTHQKARQGTSKERPAPALSFSLMLFQHARENLDLYRALAGSRGGTIALDTIRAILTDLIRDELRANEGQSSKATIPRDLVVQYLVGAYMSVLTWWLDHGAKLPPETVDAMFRQLTTRGALSSV